MEIRSKMSLFFILASFFLFSFHSYSLAEDQEKKEAGFSIWKPTEMGFLTGFSSAKLGRRENYYKYIPMVLYFGFDLNRYSRRSPDTSLSYQVGIELFSSVVTEPNTNGEIGITPIIKINYPLSNKLTAFAKGGIGIIYTSQHTKQEGSQYLFTPQLGLGIQYALVKKGALSLEFRFRHASNAGLEKPNEGIDSKGGLLGLSFYLF